MRILAPILLVILLLEACDSPDGPASGNDTSLRITDVTPDTLYQEDPAWIVVRGLEAGHLSRRLFVHTSEAAIDTLINDTLYFRVPVGAQSARPRLVLNDTIALIADSVLHVLPSSRADRDCIVEVIRPVEAYDDDLITFAMIEPPFAAKDVRVWISDSLVPLESYTNASFAIRVTPRLFNGAIRVQFFDRPIQTVGAFTKLTRTGSFLPSKQIRAVSVVGTKLRGRTLRDEQGLSLPTVVDTVITLLMNNWDFSTRFIQSGDSLICLDSITVGLTKRVLDIRFVLDPITKRISGRLRSFSILREGATNESSTEIELVFAGLNWRYDNGAYVITAAAGNITPRLLSVKFETINKALGVRLYATEFAGGLIDSELLISFTP